MIRESFVLAKAKCISSILYVEEGEAMGLL